jgi:hypothetical protein
MNRWTKKTFWLLPLVAIVVIAVACDQGMSGGAQGKGGAGGVGGGGWVNVPPATDMKLTEDTLNDHLAKIDDALANPNTPPRTLWELEDTKNKLLAIKATLAGDGEG